MEWPGIEPTTLRQIRPYVVSLTFRLQCDLDDMLRESKWERFDLTICLSMKDMTSHKNLEGVAQKIGQPRPIQFLHAFGGKSIFFAARTSILWEFVTLIDVQMLKFWYWYLEAHFRNPRLTDLSFEILNYRKVFADIKPKISAFIHL